MKRRNFLHGTLASAFAPGLIGAAQAIENKPHVMTVNGPIEPDDMGLTLPHEHVMVDFIGAAQVSRDRYDDDEVFRVVLPHLKQVAALGCRTLVECTPAYLARDAALLKRLSQATGLGILTNTGYYNARNGLFLPAHAQTESAEQIAARWISEATDGIDRTGIKPGFIKIGVNAPLQDNDKKLARAAAICHRQTGLTTAAHTGPAISALAEIDIFRDAGVDPSAWIWVHAQSERDMTKHIEAGKRGAWVSFDGVGPPTVAYHVTLASNMKRAGLLNRTLLSHDAGWYNVGQPGGGRFRPYDTLFKGLLPALRKAGFSDAEIHQLTVTNPAEALAIRKRLL